LCLYCSQTFQSSVECRNQVSEAHTHLAPSTLSMDTGPERANESKKEHRPTQEIELNDRFVKRKNFNVDNYRGERNNKICAYGWNHGTPKDTWTDHACISERRFSLSFNLLDHMGVFSLSFLTSFKLPYTYGYEHAY